MSLFGCSGWALLLAQTVKESTCSAGDPGLIRRSGRSPGKGNDYPLQYYWMDFPGSSDSKESSWMQETWVLSLGQENLLEKGMAIHSSILAWKIPWTEETGGLQSMELQRAGQDWATNTTTTTLDFINIKMICSVKDNIRRISRHATD